MSIRARRGTPRSSWLLAAGLLGASLFASGTLSAQPAVSFDTGVTVGPNPNSYLPGMVEVLVTIRNPTTSPVVGTVIVKSREGSPERREATAEFSAAAGASSLVRVPIQAEIGLVVQVQGPNGGILAQSELYGSSEDDVRVFDATQPSRLRPVLENLPIATTAVDDGGAGPPAMMSPPPVAPPNAGPRLRVLSAVPDPANGSPLLPTHAAAWHGVDVVVLPSHSLVALGDDELEALATYVLGGGTLAVAVDRPDDLRHPTLTAFTGGEASPSSPEPCFRSFVLPFPASPATAALDTAGERPSDALGFTSFEGGNLRPSLFGASASYGLGEVTLLGFDPQNPVHASDPWAQVRMIELARRGHDRGVISSTRVGHPAVTTYTRSGVGIAFGELRRMLDPNRSASWAIAVASLLISVYSIVAGPVIFARAKKQNRPLQALRILPILSAGTFVLVLLIGLFARGVRTTANRMTVVDVGAGMTVGAGRHYRSFYSPSAQSLDVGQTKRTSMLDLAMDVPTPARLGVDREATRLVGLEGEPAQTLVVREDGLVRLGGSIDVLEGEGGEVVVTNGLASPLEALVVRLPDGSFRYQKSLGPGESISSSQMDVGNTMFNAWTASARRPGPSLLAPSPPLATGSATPSAALSSSPSASGSASSAAGWASASAPPPSPPPTGKTKLPAAPKGMAPPPPRAPNRLNADALSLALRKEGARSTGEAWIAIEESVGPSVDWFPEGVPVVLAEVAGGTGEKTDSGVSLSTDRLLVRVVGFGGRR